MPWLRRRWHAWLLDGWDHLKGSYWFWPTCMTLLAGGLAIGLVSLDRRLPASWTRLLPWIRDAGPDGVRATLAAIAGSMITVAGVAFSITIVALTLASSQFGPRILRNFMHDRGNQLVLGTFLSTFLYCLMVLATVGGRADATFIPHVATIVGLGLGIASLFVLIYFIHHAASSIQVATIIDDVAHDIAAQLPVLFPDPIGRPPPAGAPAGMEEPPANAVPVTAEETGYVRVLDTDLLLALGTRCDVVVYVRRHPGSFVAFGTVLAHVAPAENVDQDVAASVRRAFALGPERTPVQDIRFLTGQLVEIAVRALSPGINDPQTAIACIHRLGWTAGAVAAQADPAARRHDAAGAVRLVAEPTDFAGLLTACFDRVRHYGAAAPDVAIALAEALAEVGERAGTPERRRLVTAQVDAVESIFEASAPAPLDAGRVRGTLARVRRRIAIASATNGAEPM